MNEDSQAPQVPETPEAILPEKDELEIQQDRSEELAALLDEAHHMVTYQVGGKLPSHLVALNKEHAKTRTKKAVTDYPAEFVGLTPPKTMFENKVIGDMKIPILRTNPQRYRNGVLSLRGRGSMDAPIDVLFVTACVLQEEYDCGKGEPQMLRGAPGNLFFRHLSRSGIRESRWYYTAIAKYNTPKLKLSAADIRWGLPALTHEIQTLQPRLIVCLGKQPMDFFLETRRLPLRDVQGGFFMAKNFGIPIYMTDAPHVLVVKPELTDRFLTDLRMVKQFVDSARGVLRVQVPQQYVKITKATELAGLMMRLKAKETRELAVDCEWHGQTAYGGKLRSFQLCWAPGAAAYVRLMDEKAKYAFDVPLETVGKIVGPVMNDPQVKFIGHNASADMPWLHHHVGIDVYQKFSFDTMYAQHTVNEYADLKLERLSVKYTDLGRYDIDLLLWKKSKKFDDEDNEGYGFVPERILFPYACLHKKSLVCLEDGTWETIQSLVRRRYAGRVLSLVGNQVVPNRVVGWHRSSVGQKHWLKIVTTSVKGGRWGALGPVFTPDHQVLTQRGKVRVDQLRPGFDSLVTEEAAFSAEQLSVLLGCLLGDGGFSRQNQSGVGFRFSQRVSKAAYADWKAGVFANFKPELRASCSRLRSWELPFSRQLYSLSRRFVCKSVIEHAHRKLRITQDVLNHIGDLGLAVWYQDDGTLVSDCRSSHQDSRIYCCLTRGEQTLVTNWLRSRFGPGVSYNKRNRFIQITGDAFVAFHAAIRKHVHPVMSYKIPGSGVYCVPNVLGRSSGRFLDLVAGIVPWVAPSGSRGHGVRYCLTVETAGNFLTKAGFVSNCRDVDATLRSRIPLSEELQAAGLTRYYQELILPFVTDGFFEMMDHGLPIDMAHLDLMRETFTRNRDRLIRLFRQDILKEAEVGMEKALKDMVGDRWQSVFIEIVRLMREKTEEATAQAAAVFKSCIRGMDDNDKYLPLFLHYMVAPVFNINSPAHLSRWLFEVCKFTPVKTTKRDGLTFSWDKVLKMSIKERAEMGIVPATDKQTLKILSQHNPLVARLEELKSVANVVKAFLKGPDEETGREQGMHKWIQQDGRIHCNFALTETARPRAWKPNILNWPKAITKPIESGFRRINESIEAELRAKLEAMSPDQVADRAAIEAEILRETQRPTSLRSNVCAPPGWVVIDMDLKTAEIVALAYQSGDDNMIKVLTEPDVQFARIDKDNPKKVVRICYNENEGIPESEWDPSLLVSTDDPRILRNADGSIVHPKRDLHWEMGTAVAKKPREKCDERMVRDGCGKVGNFSIPYGATSTLLERMIEANTGIKPPEHTGLDMIYAWETRYPRAKDFQKKMEAIVADPGFWTSLSGRIRRFAFAELDDLSFYEQRKKDGLYSGLARQARNFPCQELVAATTARALLMFIEQRRAMRLRSRVGILLYDAVTAFSVLDDAVAASALLRECLTVRNRWQTPTHTFNFDVDVSVGFRWGVKPTAEEKKILAAHKLI